MQIGQFVPVYFQTCLLTLSFDHMTWRLRTNCRAAESFSNGNSAPSLQLLFEKLCRTLDLPWLEVSSVEVCPLVPQFLYPSHYQLVSTKMNRKNIINLFCCRIKSMAGYLGKTHEISNV